jgi:Arc/MetJ-type ribon-helix-helix transcriptional regulator
MQANIQLDGRRRPVSETEKITVNLGPVDLGQIDLLVEQGLYSNRSDFIRSAIRSKLDHHQSVIQETARSWSLVLGAEHITNRWLEERREQGKKVAIRVIGALSFAKDVDSDLARSVIDSITVFGTLRLSPALREALADRITKRPT